MTEIWKKIPGFPNYSVSSEGRIRFDGRRHEVIDSLGRHSVRNYRPKVLKPTHADGHYPSVSLLKNGERTRAMVHTYVALAFIGKRPKDMQVRHVDGDKTNNKAKNIRYGTVRENAGDKAKHGTLLSGEKCSWAKLTEKDVRAIRRRAKAGEVQRRLSEEYGVNPMQISRIVRGERWGHVR